MKLLISYLTYNDRHYTFPHYINLLNSSTQKDNWKIIILTHTDDTEYYESLLKNTNFNYQVFKINELNNYMNKINFSINYAKLHNIPYIMKCDNDLFFKGETLDYMINNLELLNDNNLTIGPELSSGIPCVEYFVQDFLNNEEQNILHKKFLDTRFTNIWGATYTHLNKYTKDASEWNGKEFYNAVKQNTHHYKGIHPIRINLDSIQYLNSCIINNKSKFYNNNTMSIIYDNSSPYLCNSVFCIRTDIYDKIVNDMQLYVDSFDEVPLNKYAWKNKCTHLFVKNGFGIHMYYNTIPNHRIYELDFCNKFFN